MVPLELIHSLVLANSSGSSSGGGVLGGLILFFLLLGFALLAIWIWALIHCINNRRLTDTNRLIGILLIILLGHLGCLIYLFLPRESHLQR
jgi:hypothetical protein